MCKSHFCDTLSAITAAVMLWIQISKFKKMIEEQEAWISSTPPEPD
jgi:hypothetical protein